MGDIINDIGWFDGFFSVIMIYSVIQCVIKGFTLSLELTAKAHRLGYKIIEIPTIWKERDNLWSPILAPNSLHLKFLEPLIHENPMFFQLW